MLRGGLGRSREHQSQASPPQGQQPSWGWVHLRAQQEKQQHPAWPGPSRWTSKHDGCFNVPSLERIFLPDRRQTQKVSDLLSHR